MKKIVLITTGQPAINPRIVKEADSLSAAGYDVTVLYCHCIKWASDCEEKILSEVSWKYKLVGGSPSRRKLLYQLTRVRFKLARLLSSVSAASVLAERAQARAFDELLRAAKQIKADLYIGHNLGALPVAVLAAKHNGAMAGFDFEDYHRGEYRLTDKNRKRVVWLESKYVPALSYYSCSSPLIAYALDSDHPKFRNDKIVLLNCFPIKQQPSFRNSKSDSKSLKLIWFSQTIGDNRGLETVIAALKELNNSQIQLTLVGRCTEVMKRYILKNTGQSNLSIHFAGVIHPSDLPTFASQFDIGLATETGFSENNDKALSNKLFTYLLAGNAVILSSTKMQKQFNECYEVGELYSIGNTMELAHKIKFYMDRERLHKQRLHNFQLAARTLNWDKQASKMFRVIEKLKNENNLFSE